MIKAVETVTGRPVPFVDADRRQGDPPRLYPDASLAREMLEWKTQYTTLEDIVATAVDRFSRTG